MKKLITGILATLSCLTIFAGCGLTNTNSTPNSSSGNVEQEALTLAEVKGIVEEMYRKKDTETRVDYTLISKYENFNISWSVNVQSGVTISEPNENGVVTVTVDKNLEEDLVYTLTATISDGTNTETINFEGRKVLKAPSVVPSAITKAPVAETAYKLYMYQVTKNRDLYFTGSLDSQGFYLATTYEDQTYADGADVYVEAVEGKEGYFYLTFTDKDNVKQYIGITNTYNNGSWHDNVVLAQSTAAVAGKNINYEWTYSTEYETIVSTLEGVKDGNDENTTESSTETFYLGTYKTYMTFGASNVDKIEGDDACIGYLVTMLDKNAIPAEDKLAKEVETLSVETTYNGAATVTLPTVGTTYPDVTIAWAVKGTAPAGVTLSEDGKTLTVAAPAAETKVTLTATFACGEKTETKDVEFTFKPVVTTQTIAEIKAAENGKYQAEGVVVGVNAQSFLLKDSTGMMLVYKGYSWSADVAVGDKLTVSGTTSVYGCAKQFGQDAVYTKNGTETVTPGTAKALTVAECDAYKTATTVEPIYVTITATLSISSDSKYYNLAIEGATIKGSITYPTATDKTALAALNGKKIDVTGYVTGTASSGAYLNLMVTSFAESANTDPVPPVGGETGGETGGDDETTTDVLDVNASYSVSMKIPAGTYYATGALSSGKYLATSLDAAEAVEIKVEKDAAGYKFYFMANSTKTYINVKETSATDAKAQFELSTTTGTVYVYDEATNSWQTTIGSNSYYLGTYTYNNNTYSTASVSKASYITADNTGKTQFPLEIALKATTDALAPTDEERIAAEKDALTLAMEVTGAKEITLATKGATYGKVAITWAVATHDNATISNGKLVLTAPAADTTVTVTATLTAGEATDTKVFTIALKVPAPSTSGVLATFEFGENGTATHADGSDLGASKSYTDSGYTLQLEEMYKVYGPARDAKGNSCIKLGTGSIAGKLKFTVPANVTKVVIKVAAYKANTASVKINDTTTSLTKKSNNGEYDEIEIDTSSTKTVDFSVSSGYRVMINSIVFM